METVKVEICLSYPPKVNAPGLMTLLSNVTRLGNILDYSAPRVELQMILTFVLTQAIHFVLKRLRIPIFISQILAGIMLGPTVFRHDDPLITMSENSVSILGTVASFGYLFFLFLAGVKMDFSMTYRSGKKALCIGILTVLVPSLVCLFMAHSAPEERQRYRPRDVYVLAVAHSTISFPVIHSLLSGLKLLNSELGRLGLSSALIGNMLSLLLLTVSQGVIAAHRKGLERAIEHLRGAIVFIVVLVFCFRPLMKWMVRKMAAGGKINSVCLYAAILSFMVAHTVTSTLQIMTPFGPFLTGLAIQDGPPLGSALVEKMEPPLRQAPSTYRCCGFDCQIWSLLPVSFFWKIPTRDALAFAFIMISKGVVEMAIYSNMYDRGVITAPIFAYMTLIIIVVASIVPMLVKALYDPSRKYASFHKRSIMHCKYNEELRMLSCVHVPANVNSIIDILSTSTKESPIALHVLHLIKLSGRATPLFISHDKNQNTLSNDYYSENVVLSFKRFERDNWGAVSVKAYTAVTPTNMIIESDNQTIRSLNYSMLEKAPCSIGILVEGRRRLNRYNSQPSSNSSSSYNIAVIFLGGKDDQEALALGLRMSENKNVQLTIIHLTSGNMILADDTETMEDEIMLRNVKENIPCITHIEKQVSDGPETLDFLRFIVDNYQLFIVGRRYKREDPQTMGLHEWTEFQEIGIIGDLLSSADFGGNNSVLIVQNQQRIG
ncbi:putative Cation/H+ exchanger 4 [Hibiscus syriacus]|uniref:Cation/H+ exchanger 4 n=1 Tax=Hibiscus syriacus TaxID=106335 RepID=A0A6A2Y187_HIBSY|nr:putative Cation/H+ exchanger 4 [Hibiscus syriacus]